MLRIKDLVRPHERHEVFRFGQVNDVVPVLTLGDAGLRDIHGELAMSLCSLIFLLISESSSSTSGTFNSFTSK